jgi:hypothetical protein
MNGWSRPSVFAVAVCLGIAAVPSARAQQPVAAFDGVYDSTGSADPQNAIQCGLGAGAIAITVKNGKLAGPDSKPVDIGPNGVAESDGKLLLGGSVTVPYKAVYHFNGSTMDGALTVTRMSGGSCIYHRHGTKRP